MPYGTTQCKWDSIIPLDAIWEQYNRILKDNGAVVLFAAQPFTTKLIHSNMRNFRYCWYWKKNTATGGMFAKAQPMRCVEDICVFYKKKPIYNPQGLVKLKQPIHNKPNTKTEVYKWRGKKESLQRYTGYPKNLLEYKKEFGLHPTQKPVQLLEYIIRTYTNENDMVLDNCMGSGSTGIACINTNRRFIGMEKDSECFSIASKRIRGE